MNETNISTGDSSIGERRQKDSDTLQTRWDADITLFYLWLTTGWQK